MGIKHYYQTRYSFDRRRDAIWKYTAGYIQRFIPVDSNILDIGAGYCSFINNIKASKKHALDQESSFAQYAAKDVICHVGSFNKMNEMESGYFDVIFASNILEHLTKEDLDSTILKIKMVLKKPAGKLIILQPNFRYSYKVYFDDFTHRQVFTDKSMVDFLEGNSFRIIKTFPRFIPFSFKSALPKFGPLVWLYIRLPFKIFAGQMLIVAENKC